MMLWVVGIGCVRGLFANVATRWRSGGVIGSGWRRCTRASAAGATRWRSGGVTGEWLAQVYARHRGGREKVAIKVMQVPGDRREGVTEGGWRRCTRGTAAGARRWRSR